MDLGNVRISMEVSGLEPSAWDLKPGLYILGTSADCNFPMNHPSVAERHCELEVDISGGVLVRDLGTSAGTFVNNELITEARLLAGRELKVGDVIIRLVEVEAQKTVAASTKSSMKSDQGYSALIKAIPEAFAYPIKGYNFTQILGIMVGLAAIQLLGKIKIFLFFGFVFRLILLLFFVVCLVYIFCFYQQIVQSAAQGETSMPRPPDIGLGQAELIENIVQIVGVLLVCFGPGLAAVMIQHKFLELPKYLPEILFGIGLCYFPAAFLLVSLYENLLGASPHAVLPIMIVLGPSYLVVLIVGVFLVACVVAFVVFTTKVLPFNWLVYILTEALILYSLTVFMRVLGLSEWFNRKKTARLLP